MKKKLYVLSMVTILSLTCIGCGNKDVAVNTEAATETTTEVTTEEITTETEKATTETTTRETTEEKTTEKKTDTKEEKTENKQNQSSGSTTQTTAQTTKTNNSTSNTVATTGSNTQSSNTTPASGQTTTTECQHEWVHYDAVMGERCVRPGTVAHWYCYNCQRYFLTHQDDPCWGISSNGSEASYVLDPGEFETYEVTPAYDKCSKCGATK
ncbi:MAG: hypothetical protein ACI4GW_07510 [Lachnospiraceae bacterium]